MIWKFKFMTPEKKSKCRKIDRIYQANDDDEGVDVYRSLRYAVDLFQSSQGWFEVGSQLQSVAQM